MKTNNALTVPMIAMLFAGCMPPGEAEDEEDFGTTTEEVAIPPGTFIHHHVVSGFNCGPHEVMIGIHEGTSKVICAELNFNYRIADRYADPPGGIKVSFSPAMHGCAPNYFIQGITHYASGEFLECVSLETPDGVGLTYSGTLHDGRGSTVIASVPTYNLSPNMHVCPANFAMAGFHKAANDLYCAK